MRLPPALLEAWMRKYYFSVDFDIGSSGVENFSLAELRALLGFTQDDLDRIVLRDSQTLGGAGLRRAIAERWLQRRENQVLVTHGSSEANFLVMNTLLEPGDEVVVQDPRARELEELDDRHFDAEALLLASHLNKAQEGSRPAEPEREATKVQERADRSRPGMGQGRFAEARRRVQATSRTPAMASGASFPGPLPVAVVADPARDSRVEEDVD